MFNAQMIQIFQHQIKKTFVSHCNLISECAAKVKLSKSKNFTHTK